MKIHEPPMTFRSDSAKAEWAIWLESQKSDYGLSVFRFASEFATRAEYLMAENRKRSVYDIFQQACRNADSEGVSSSMFRFASAILSSVWIHGDEYDRWVRFSLGGS